MYFLDIHGVGLYPLRTLVYGMVTQGAVSILIPTYYRDSQLVTAIESALSQTHSPVEIIVVDDSGEGYAADIVAEYDVTYIPHETHAGANQARNTAYEHSSGEYIQFLDDDDQLPAEKIERQLSLFQNRPDVGVVYCGLKRDGHREYPQDEYRGDVLQKALEFDLYPCYTCSMLIRRSIVEKIMPLPESESADDLKMMIELAALTDFDFVPEMFVTKTNNDGRGSGMTNIQATFDILESHATYYRRVHPDVERRARSNIYRWQGKRLLEDRIWSPQAVVSYWKSFRWAPKKSVKHLGIALAATFGRPGLKIGTALVGSDTNS